MLLRCSKKAMQQNNFDTIVAISTASGAGGIGVVRVSGQLAATIAAKILGQCPAPRHAAYLPFYDANQQLIDRGIAIFYQNPHSYTGEDVLELQAHGGTALMQILLARCIALGARQAEPGEFTRRAYLNDKIDLAQAEAVADVINASTVEAARSAMRSLSGEFSKSINDLLAKLINLRMYVEACLDFPEEEIDFITQGKVAEKLADIVVELNLVFAKAKQGSLLREGMHIVLVGQPNVGKSSLMNQLSGEEVAIVTPIAGTTRDAIKNIIQINGLPLHIIDTAGLRDTEDEVEKIGIARTWSAVDRAGAALLITAAGEVAGDEEVRVRNRLPLQLPVASVRNKIDLLTPMPVSRETSHRKPIGENEAFDVSALTGHGIDALRRWLLVVAGWQPDGEGVFLARERHLRALAEASQHIDAASTLDSQFELFAEELRLAQRALSSITGQFTPDDLLGEIFGRFCIGK